MFVKPKLIAELANDVAPSKSDVMAPRPEQKRSYNALVLFIICLGAILRVYNFWVPPIWVDEYGTWWVVAADAWSEVIERTLRIQGQSPFYYLLVRTIAGLGRLWRASITITLRHLRHRHVGIGLSARRKDL